MKRAEDRGRWPWEQRHSRHRLRALGLVVLFVFSAVYAYTFYDYVRTWSLQPTVFYPTECTS